MVNPEMLNCETVDAQALSPIERRPMDCGNINDLTSNGKLKFRPKPEPTESARIEKSGNRNLKQCEEIAEVGKKYEKKLKQREEIAQIEKRHNRNQRLGQAIAQYRKRENGNLNQPQESAKIRKKDNRNLKQHEKIAQIAKRQNTNQQQGKKTARCGKKESRNQKQSQGAAKIRIKDNRNRKQHDKTAHFEERERTYRQQGQETAEIGKRVSSHGLPFGLKAILLGLLQVLVWHVTGGHGATCTSPVTFNITKTAGDEVKLSFQCPSNHCLSNFCNQVEGRDLLICDKKDCKELPGYTFDDEDNLCFNASNKTAGKYYFVNYNTGEDVVSFELKVLTAEPPKSGATSNCLPNGLLMALTVLVVLGLSTLTS